MTVFPYATQQAGWADFATQLDGELDALNPATLMPGMSGGLIGEHIDALHLLTEGATRLADSAHDLAAECGTQDGFDRELASAVSREEVADAEKTASQARAMMRAGTCDPAVAELLNGRAESLAREREEAVAKHAAQTAGTHFDEPESVCITEVGEGGEANKKDDGDGTIGKGETSDGGTGADTGEKKGEKPEEPSNKPEPGVKPLPEIVTPEPSGSTQTPAARVFSPDGSVELRPERVQPETALSSDGSVIRPSSTLTMGQTPAATVPTQQPWQPVQYSGITPTQSRMLGHVNPNNQQQQRRGKQEPEWNRPVSAETLAAIPVSHAVPVTSPTPITPTPNVSPTTTGTPGTHTSSATTPAPTAPSGQTPSGAGPTPVGGAPTIGPGSKTATTAGGMREKPAVPETLRAVLSEETVRDLERSLANAFPDPEPTPPPGADPIPTGALR
ncbi:MAG: hypothetical protein WAV90_23000 [Gordonia amarae]